jgi:hypothetical protein
METVRYSFRVRPSEIAYLRTTIESYDGMALVTTLDPTHALVEVCVAPGCERFLFDMLAHLRKHEDLVVARVKEIQADRKGSPLS